MGRNEEEWGGVTRSEEEWEGMRRSEEESKRVCCNGWVWMGDSV